MTSPSPAELLSDPRLTTMGLLVEVHAGLRSAADPDLEAHGLAGSSCDVLIRLARSPEQRLRMSDLAAQSTLSNSGLTRVIDRLLGAGLVERVGYPVSELFSALMMVSGNDAANVLASAAGGQQATAQLMNDKARSLHAYDTRAVNPHGLDAEGQVSSAYDLALIARAGMADPAFAAYAAMKRGSVSAPGSISKVAGMRPGDSPSISTSAALRSPSPSGSTVTFLPRRMVMAGWLRWRPP